MKRYCIIARTHATVVCYCHGDEVVWANILIIWMGSADRQHKGCRTSTHDRERDIWICCKFHEICIFAIIFCVVVVISSITVESCYVFTPIVQGCFTGHGACFNLKQDQKALKRVSKMELKFDHLVKMYVSEMTNLLCSAYLIITKVVCLIKPIG